MDALELLRLNLLSPMVLAFALGVLATLALHAPDDWTGVIAQAGAFLGSPDDRRHHGVEHSWLADRLE
ncbi:MAG: hypothetical protein R6X23_05425, partial [Acidimicrobiia bacterium]